MVVDPTDSELPPRPKRTLGHFLLYILASIVALVVIGQLIALASPPQRPDAAMLAATGTIDHPTRPSSPTSKVSLTLTATNTQTPLPTAPPPPTNTPEPTPTIMDTPLPIPTNAVLPSDTPLPIPTNTSEPTRLPVPTNTIPPTLTPLPPTATPAPLTVLERIEIDNGTWGKRQIIVRYESDASGSDQFYVTGTDGYRYHVTMGFLSSPEALAKTQEYWTFGGRGSANWGMVILVRKQIADWYFCSATSNVCYNPRIDSGQAVVFTDVFLRDAVWKSLLNDYLSGGILGTTSDTYYYEIQKTIFDPICHLTPTIPCIGFIFTRVS
jgi:hypothetical protein